MTSRRTLLCALVLAFGLVSTSIAHSPDRSQATATVKGKKIVIDYGRPSLKGRDLLGKAPVGQVWRLGRNEATTIQTDADLVIGGTVVKAGKYSLWAKKTGPDAWTLAFHPKTMNGEKPLWGAPELREGYVAELPLTATKTDQAAEELTIELAEEKGKGVVAIHWGTARYAGTFDVK